MKTTPLGYSSGTGSIRKSNIKKGMEAECRHGRIEIKLEPRINAPDELKVFRILDKTFMFGTHYLKHFEAMSPKRNDHYAGGTFICDSEGEWAYRDEAVDFGNTYVYWMEKSCGTRIGPFPVKMRDPGIWWPYQTIYERMVEIAARHQGMVEFKSFGTSTGGRDIAGLIVGNRQRLVAIIGLIHAGESGPELMIPAVERLLIEDGDLLKKIGISILPNANPDERERNAKGIPYYLRKNAHGVDLNRNFPSDWEVVDYMYGNPSDNPTSGTYRGDSPASEPETHAVMRHIEELRPDAVFSYHWLASICGACFLGCKVAESDLEYVQFCRRFAQVYTDGMYGEGLREINMRFGTTPGSLPAWIYRTFRVPAFDLENDGHPDAQPAATDRTTPDLLRLYQDRHYSGLKNVLKMMTSIF